MKETITRVMSSIVQITTCLLGIIRSESELGVVKNDRTVRMVGQNGNVLERRYRRRGRYRC